MNTSDAARQDWLFLLMSVPVVILLVWGSCHCVSLLRPERQVAGPTDTGPTVTEKHLAYLRGHGTDLQRDLANKVFRYGDPVEQLLAAHKPIFRCTDGEKTYLVFHSPDPPRSRGRTVLVLAEKGKLVLADTNVSRGADEQDLLVFFPVLRVEPWSAAWDWDSLEETVSERLPPVMAVLGCPILVGQLRQAGWWPD